jgi:hypothetical protein
LALPGAGQPTGAAGHAPGLAHHAASPVRAFGFREQAEVPAAGISSPAQSLAAPRGQGGLRLDVNAELVIYGSTEPDAALTVAGQPVRLRPEGTFSLRFVLPDGDFALAIEAMAPDGDQRRGVALGFRRRTTHIGAVGAHPQDPALGPPPGDAAAGLAAGGGA